MYSRAVLFSGSLEPSWHKCNLQARRLLLDSLPKSSVGHCFHCLLCFTTADLIICCCPLSRAQHRHFLQPTVVCPCSVFLSATSNMENFLQKSKWTHSVMRKFSDMCFYHKGWYLLMSALPLLLVLGWASGAYCCLFSSLLCCDLASWFAELIYVSQFSYRASPSPRVWFRLKQCHQILGGVFR